MNENILLNITKWNLSMQSVKSIIMLMANFFQLSYSGILPAETSECVNIYYGGTVIPSKAMWLL